MAESLEQLRWLENDFKIGVALTDMETIGIDTPEDVAKVQPFLQISSNKM
jgi:3-deoxy-manno-octulosonate cytidylyltransferase (CMP-KDO synthetase)